MKALKDMDMAAYHRLLDGHKNDRLTALLAQTDSYLRELSRLIKGGGAGQQGDAARAPRAYIGKGNRRGKKEREEREQWEKRERAAGRTGTISWAERQAQLRLEESRTKETEEGKDGAQQQQELSEEKEASEAAAAAGGEETGSVASASREEKAESESRQDDDVSSAVSKEEAEDDGLSLNLRLVTVSEQPRLLSGGTLKGYQLKGLEWLVSLYDSNMNGSAKRTADCTHDRLSSSSGR